MFQEQTETSHKVPVVEHRGDINQSILNTAQMRDAKHVQKHCIPSQPLDFDTTVHESTAKAVDVRKAAEVLLASGSNKKTTPAMRERGRGSLRGYSGHSRGSELIN